ncbi:MAG: hypothetical protein ABI442_14550 [Gemmatimonadaceae bacterium]
MVETAFERGWAALQNGALIEAAESTGFSVFITTDKNLRYQQDFRGRRLAILVLWTTSWPELEPHASLIGNAATGLGVGEFRELVRPT